MHSPNLSGRKIPRNPGLLELIRAKREWHWKPSVEELRNGFRGWYQRGYLPHFDAPGVTQFITFQLHDSFPVTRRTELEAILKEAEVPQTAADSKHGWIAVTASVGCAGTRWRNLSKRFCLEQTGAIIRCERGL